MPATRLSTFECKKLVEMINKHVPPGQPDIKFDRAIGEYARQPYSVTGELLSERDYEKHLSEMLPQEADIRLVHEIQSYEKQWISPKASIQ